MRGGPYGKQKQVDHRVTTGRSPKATILPASTRTVSAAGPSQNIGLAEALREIDRLKAQMAQDTELSRLKEEVKHGNKYHEGFMKGLEKGLEMASGRMVTTPASGANL